MVLQLDPISHTDLVEMHAVWVHSPNLVAHEGVWNFEKISRIRESASHWWKDVVASRYLPEGKRQREQRAE